MRNYGWKILKNLKKEIQVIWSRDWPRPLLFGNCSQRFSPLAKRIASVSLYQNTDPTNYEISSECFEALQFAWEIGVHWPVLDSPSLNKIFVRGTSHSDRFYEKTVSSYFLDPQKVNGLLRYWWQFRPKGFLGKTGRGWSRDAIINNC